MSEKETPQVEPPPEEAKLEQPEKTIAVVDVLPPPRPNAASLVAIGEKGIMLRSFEELIRFARFAVQQGAAPKGMTEGQAAIAIEAGLERGLGPLGGLAQLAVINGVPSWKGQAALALIRNSKTTKPGTLKSWVEGEGDERRGVAVAWRLGDSEISRREFSIKDAKRAGLWANQGPWTKYPDGQLEWRAVGLLGRYHFSDVLGGFPLAEEAQDFEALPPARVRTVDPPKPAGHDPLLDVVDPKSVGDVLDAEIVADSPEEPPFASHEEADRELAAEETRDLGGLFGGAE